MCRYDAVPVARLIVRCILTLLGRVDRMLSPFLLIQPFRLRDEYSVMGWPAAPRSSVK